MDQNPNFIRQVNLIVRLLPVIAANNRFGLKGGTAINLFLQQTPRLSVDIDLVFLPRLQRDSAISEIRRQLNEICLSARETIPQRARARKGAGMPVTASPTRAAVLRATGCRKRNLEARSTSVTAAP